MTKRGMDKEFLSLIIVFLALIAFNNLRADTLLYKNLKNSKRVFKVLLLLSLSITHNTQAHTAI
jgi:hypothetical protein